MSRSLKIALFASIALVLAGQTTSAKKPTKTNISPSIHTLTVKNIDGKDVKLSTYKGKVLLLVNTASRCGYTYQYKGMQEIHTKYAKKGFSVLAFPCNDFGGQEPGTHKQIKAFCTGKFKTTFPIFSKVKVKGKKKTPLYALLTDKSKHSFGGAITWNFNKFLIGKDGRILARFGSSDEPNGAKVTKAIEKALK